MFWKKRTDRQEEIINALCNGSVQFSDQFYPVISLAITKYFGEEKENQIKKIVTTVQSFYWLNTLYVSFCLQMCQDAGIRSPKLDDAINDTFWKVLVDNAHGILKDSLLSKQPQRIEDINFFWKNLVG